MGQFQKEGTVALVCLPTRLHKAWAEGGDFEAELNKLGYSEDGLSEARELLNGLPRQPFVAVAAALKHLEAWAGDEPHPPDHAAHAIIQKMKELDGEQ